MPEPRPRAGANLKIFLKIQDFFDLSKSVLSSILFNGFHSNLLFSPHVPRCRHGGCGRAHSSFMGTCAGLQRKLRRICSNRIYQGRFPWHVVLILNPSFMLGCAWQFDPQVQGDVSRLETLDVVCSKAGVLSC